MQQVPGVQIDTVNVAGNASAVAGGPDFISKGSGNVTYQVDGSTITDNTYGNPLGRQNGGDEHLLRLRHLLGCRGHDGRLASRLQNPGVQINVVTKRGTNELRGSSRFLYASGNWQSDNTSEEALEQGFLTNRTRYVREYGAEIGGPIIKDKLWLWASGSRQDISVQTTQPDVEAGSYAAHVKLIPFSAKLNTQISSANSLNLFFSRSNRIEEGRNSSSTVTLRTPETLTNLFIPTNFYKIEDNHVFSSTLFASIFANYQDVTYDSIPRGGGDPRGFPAGQDVQLDYYDFQYHNSWYYYYAKDPQKAVNGQASKFFNTGSANHELKVSFNYRTQIADSQTGLPGDQLYGIEYSYSSALALIARGVRTTYKTNYISATLGDTITFGNLTINAGLRYDLQQSRNLPGRSFANEVFPDLLPEVRFAGVNDWQFEYTNWQPRASITYAMGEKKNTLARASYGKYADQLGFISYYGSGVPISNGYYYYWTDNNRNHRVERDEIDLDGGFYSFYNDIDPAFLPNIPNQIQPDFKTPATDELTAGLDHQIFDDFAVSATYTYRNTKNLQDAIPIGSNINTYDFLGTAQGTAVDSRGFAINFAEPIYGLNLEEPAGRKSLLQPRRSHAEVPRHRVLGGQTTIEQMDVARQLRLAELQAARSAIGDHQPQQPLGSRRPERRRCSGGRILVEGLPLHRRQLAVQRHRPLPASLGDQPRSELLRPAGLSPAVLRADEDRGHSEPAGPAPDRPRGYVPARQPVPVRHPPRQVLQARTGGGDSDGRALQRGQLGHRPAAVCEGGRLRRSGHRPGRSDRRLHAEQRLQPDPGDPEPADRPPGHPGIVLTPIRLSPRARPGIPGGPSGFSRG